MRLPPTAKSDLGADGCADPVGYPAFRLLAILMAMNVAAYLDRSILALAAPAVQADLGLDHVQLSILLGLGFVLFFVLLGLPFGWLIDRAPRRPIVFAGILLWSLAASSVGLARSFGAMLAGRIGLGAGEAVLNPAAYSLIADAVPRRRLGLSLALYGGASGVGAAVSTAAGGLLLAYAARHGDFLWPVVGTLKPWQWVLVLSGAPGLILATTIFLVPEPQRRDRAGEDAPGLTAFLREHWRFYTPVIAGFSVLQILAYGFASWQPSYMVQHFGWNIADVGLWLAIGGVMSFAGAFGAGSIVDAWSARGVADAPLRWSAFMCLWCAVFIGAAFLVPSGMACVLLVIVGQGPIAMIGIVSMAIQRVTPNEYRGRVSSLFLLFANLIGFGLGPLLPAALTDYVFGGTTSLGLSVAIVSLVAGPLAALLLWAGRAPMRAAVWPKTQSSPIYGPDPAGVPAPAVS